MSKIITLKLEIPADDDVTTEAVKAVSQAAIRALGTKESVGTPGDGQVTADRAVHFGAAQVKTWQPARQAKPGK
jgi:hypothetical protein